MRNLLQRVCASCNWSGGYVPMIANAAMRRGSFSRSAQLAASILHGCTRNILTASNQIIPARATDGQSIHQDFENREVPLHDFTSGAVCEGVKGYFAVRQISANGSCSCLRPKIGDRRRSNYYLGILPRVVFLGGLSYARLSARSGCFHPTARQPPGV